MKTFIRHFLMFALLSLNSAFAMECQVLVIGDSQSFGSFGPRLNKTLRSWKISTSYYARPGAIADWYLEGTLPRQDYGSWDAAWGQLDIFKGKFASATPKISDLLQKHKPKLVVVQLGGNMHFYKNEDVQKSVQTLLSKIGEAQSSCLWVGPPPGEKRPEPRFSEFYPFLKSVVEAQGCKFIDSREIIKPVPKGGDGIHLDTMKGGKDASKKWTEAIAKEVFEMVNQRK